VDSKKIYKVLKALSIVLICFAPLLPLIDIKAKFYFDWNNNVWAIGYFGEYFRQHFSFPGVFNTHELVGWVSPVFYGPGLYSVAGVLSSLVNASAAIRIVIILLTFLQYFCVWRLFVDKGKPWWVPHFCAILLTWSIYPVTNLFNRSALTEYYAVILLNIGIFAWFVSLEEERIKYAWVLLSSLCLATAAYSHPITAMFGALFFLPILIWSVFTFSNKSEVLKATCLLGFGSLLITSPWIYATYKFKSLLQITTQNSGVGFFPGVDTLWSRLAPIPWDGRTMDPYAFYFFIDCEYVEK
jgi:hypothetical protein